MLHRNDWKRLGLLLGLMAWLVLQPVSVWASNSAKKDFCKVSDFFSDNKPLNTARTTMTYSLTLFGGVLAALINIEAQRATMEKGLTASSTSLRALSWAGPLKAFGRVAIPLMDNTNKVIKSAKLNSRTAQIYKKVYTPLSYAWMGINAGMYGVQVAGVFVCKRANIMGVEVTRSGSKAKAQKFARLARKYKSKLVQSVSRLNKAKKLVLRYKSTFSGIKSALRPIKRPVKGMERAMKNMNRAMKPVFVAARKLVKEMQKRRCITYGVKVKVKVKKKVWKTKVKTKKVKFCFRISKVAGKITKLAKAAQKPVNDVIKNVIKPLMSKVKKGLKKAVNVGKLRRYQRKIASYGRKLSSITRQLKPFKAGFAVDKAGLQRAGRELR